MDKDFTLIVRNRTNKQTNHIFNVYSAKFGTDWVDIRFRKSCNNIPKEIGHYKVTIDTCDCNIQEREEGFNNILWIGNIIKCELIPYTPIKHEHQDVVDLLNKPALSSEVF